MTNSSEDLIVQLQYTPIPEYGLEFVENFIENESANATSIQIKKSISSVTLESQINTDIEQEHSLKIPSDVELDYHEGYNKKTWFYRVFGSLREGSIRGSVLTLLCGCVGAGVLSLPKIFSYYGILLSTLLLIFCGGFSYLSYSTLLICIKASGKNNYANQTSFYLGSFAANSLRVAIILCQWMGSTMYIVVGWNFLSHMFVKYNIISLPLLDNEKQLIDQTSTEATILRAYIIGGFYVFLVIITSFLKNLSAQRFILVPCILVYIYTILVTIVETPMQVMHNKAQNDYTVNYLYNDFTMNWFTGFATQILSFYCHPNFFYVRRELFLPNEKRIKKILIYSIVSEMVIYFLMGLFGYLSLGNENMVDLFVLRQPYARTDYAMDVAFFALFLMIITSIICNFFPSREQFMDFQNLKKTNLNYILSNIFLLGLSTITCIFFPNIMSIFALCGGLFCTFIGWTIPFLIRLTMLQNENWYSNPKFCYIIGQVFVLFVSIASTLQSICQFNF